MTAESTTFYTLVERAEDGDVGTFMGSAYRNRDVRSYGDIGQARRNRTRFANQLGKNIQILKVTVYLDGQVEWDWIS